MSISEIKEEAGKLDARDVMHLAAWFHHLARRGDGAYLLSLDATWTAMEGGDRISIDEYRRLSGDLDRNGL